MNTDDFKSIDTIMPVEASALPSDLPKKDRAEIYRWIVLALGAIALLVVIGGIALSIFGKTMPESIVVLGSVAVGALAGVLTAQAVTP